MISIITELASELSLFTLVVMSFLFIIMNWVNNHSRRLDNLVLFRVENLIRVREDFGNRHGTMRSIFKLYESEIVGGENIDNNELISDDIGKQMQDELSSYTAFVFASFREVEPLLSDYQYYESNFLRFIVDERNRTKSGDLQGKLEFQKEFTSRMEYLDHLAHKFAYMADTICYELAMGYGFIGKRIYRLKSFFSKRYHLARRVWLRERYGIDLF